MSIEDRQSEVIEMFDKNRDRLSQDIVMDIEEILDLWSELYERFVDTELLDELLDNIRLTIQEHINE